MPETALFGSAEDYLKSLEPGSQRVVGTLVLRLIAAERMSQEENGEALKCLARMERAINAYVSTLSTPTVNMAWGVLQETTKP